MKKIKEENSNKDNLILDDTTEESELILEEDTELILGEDKSQEFESVLKENVVDDKKIENEIKEKSNKETGDIFSSFSGSTPENKKIKEEKLANKNKDKFLTKFKNLFKKEKKEEKKVVKKIDNGIKRTSNVNDIMKRTSGIDVEGEIAKKKKIFETKKKEDFTYFIIKTVFLIIIISVIGYSTYFGLENYLFNNPKINILELLKLT